MRLIGIFILLTFISCKRVNENLKAKKNIKIINVEKWNDNTINFIFGSTCLSSKDMSFEKNFNSFKVKTGDSIKNFREHLNYYLRNRNILTSFLLNNKLPFSNADTLVISEDYLGAFDPKISFMVTGNKNKNSWIFHIKNDSIVKSTELDKSTYNIEYDSVIDSKTKCFIEPSGNFNNAHIETVFYINNNGDVKEASKFLTLTLSALSR